MKVQCLQYQEPQLCVQNTLNQRITVAGILSEKTLQVNAVPSLFNWTNTKPPRRALKRKLVAVANDREKEIENAEALDIQDDISEGEEVAYAQSMDKTEDERIKELERRLTEKEEECTALLKQLQLKRFGINRFSDDATLNSFYTGFENYKSFEAFFECIEPSALNMNSAYYQSCDTVSLAGRKRCMLLIDELFMFLCRLKVGMLEQDLSVRFNCSLSTVSRKIVTWSNFLYFALGSTLFGSPKKRCSD